MGSIVTSVLGLGRGKTNANYALKGFDYLKDNQNIQQAQDVGSQGLGLLGGFLNGDQGQFQGALDQFRGGVGYQDQLKQGTDAIAGSAAARGNLNSGATLKALQGYGQGLANQSLMQFLGLAQGAADMGQKAALGTGAAGTSGGSTAAKTQPENKGILGRFFGM
jgi:hypothetical protein